MNDIERDGRRRPFEVSNNAKNMEHYAWTVALTRMISATLSSRHCARLNAFKTFGRMKVIHIRPSARGTFNVS